MPAHQAPSRGPVLRRVEAYQRIRELIVSGELAPDSVITEADLTRRLDMSRTPVREALRELEAENVIRTVPAVGYVVVQLDSQDMVNIYMVRASLEALAAEQAARRATRSDLAVLDDLYDEMGEAVQAGDDQALSVLNGRFHDAIASASANTYLQSILSTIRDTFERFRPVALAHPGRRVEAHEQHGELLEAIRRHDPAAASELAERHVHRAFAIRMGAELPQHS